MIFDKEVMFADNEIFSTVGEIDLIIAGLGEDKAVGPGKPIIVAVNVGRLVPDGGNLYTVVIESSIDDGVIWGPEMIVNFGPNALATGWVSFGLPSTVSRHIRLSLTGIASGDYSAGVVLGPYL